MARFWRTKQDSPSPVSRLEVLTKLYFPELRQAMAGVALATTNFESRLVEGTLLLSKQALLDADAGKYSALYREICNSIGALCEQASLVMKEVVKGK